MPYDKSSNVITNKDLPSDSSTSVIGKATRKQKEHDRQIEEQNWLDKIGGEWYEEKDDTSKTH